MSSITEQQNQPPVAGRRTRATTDWRDDDLALLRKQWRAGASARQIVEAFGGRFTRNAVIGKANRLGLSRHDKPRTPAPGRKRKPVEPAPKGERRTRFRPPQPIADAQVASLEQLDTPTDGIGVAPKRSRFTARIMADGVDHYLGTFDTTEAAGAAYKAAARSLHGEFARTEK